MTDVPEIDMDDPLGLAVAERMRRQTRAFVIMCFVFVVALAFQGYYINENRDIAERGREAKVGICAYKQDLKQRTDALQAYADANPNGTVFITEAQIQTSLANQHAALDALSVLHCS